MAPASFIDQHPSERRKQVAELIRDLYPHRQSEKAAAMIDELYTAKPKSLRDYQAEVFEINTANGWFDSERAFDDDIALLHSEVTEMLEAYRDHGFDDATAEGSYSGESGGYILPKPEGFGSEAADVLVRLLDTAQRRDVEFLFETLREIPPHQGFKPDAPVGTHIRKLHGMIANISELNPNLNFTLTYLKTWCDHLEIELEVELVRKLAYNRTRGYRHGGKRV